MPLYMVAIWEIGRVAYQRSMIVGSYKLAFLAIQVDMYTSGLPAFWVCGTQKPPQYMVECEMIRR